MNRYTIVKAVQTSQACPAQWDAWTDTGQYLYLRFRHGTGTVDEQPGPDVRSWTDESTVACFDHDELDGVISIEEFAARAGLELALEAAGPPPEQSRTGAATTGEPSREAAVLRRLGGTCWSALAAGIVGDGGPVTPRPDAETVRRLARNPPRAMRAPLTAEDPEPQLDRGEDPPAPIPARPPGVPHSPSQP